MFYELAYPIIKTKNPNALMPMEKVLNAMKEVVRKASTEQKLQLLKDIIYFATPLFEMEFEKFSERINSSTEKEKYVEARVQILKQHLKSKFGLAVD